jgi:Fe2+ transport system protein FeoA
MNRTEAWFVHISTLLVGTTGVIYAVMRYLMEPVDPFAVMNHPWQAEVLHLHLLAAPLVVFAVGLIWRRHISAHWRAGLKTGRRSGVEMILSTAPMVVSGYLIQGTVTDTWRTVWVVVHCVTSGLWLAGYLVHQAAAFLHKRNLAGTASLRWVSNSPLLGMASPVIPLDELHPGDKAIIRTIQGTTTEEAHLMEMGLLPGTPVEFIKWAPLGDPMELRVRRYHLSIRRAEARAILVDKT